MFKLTTRKYPKRRQMICGYAERVDGINSRGSRVCAREDVLSEPITRHGVLILAREEV